MVPDYIEDIELECDPNENLVFKKLDEDGYHTKVFHRFSQNKNHGTLILGQTGKSGKSFLVNCIMQKELENKNNEDTLMIVFDYKEDYPKPEFQEKYDYIKLDEDGSYGEDNIIKLNPKYFSMANWSNLFIKNGLSKGSDIYLAIKEMENRELPMEDVNKVMDYFEEFTTEMAGGSTKRNKTFYKTMRILEKSVAYDPWISHTDPGFKKYMIGNDKCIIFDLMGRKDFGEAIGYYVMQQIDDLKKIAFNYCAKILENEIKNNKKLKPEDRLSEQEVEQIAIKKLKSNRTMRTLLAKYGIQDHEITKQLIRIYKRKVIYIIDEAGDTEFGLFRKGNAENPVESNIKIKMKALATRERYRNLSFVAITQSAAMIEPEYRNQCSHKLFGRMEGTSINLATREVSSRSETEMNDILTNLKQGWFFSDNGEDSMVIEVIPPWEKENDIVWGNKQPIHLIGK